MQALTSPHEAPNGTEECLSAVNPEPPEQPQLQPEDLARAKTLHEILVTKTRGFLMSKLEVWSASLCYACSHRVLILVCVWDILDTFVHAAHD